MVFATNPFLSRRRELATVTGRAATAEAALQQQAANYEARLQQLQTLYSRQTAVVAQLRKGKVPDAVGFRNTNRFWVRHELLFEFLKHWVVREGLLQQQTGFLGLQVGENVATTIMLPPVLLCHLGGLVGMEASAASAWPACATVKSQ